MENTFFTIITPCFNSEKTIEKTLQSVLNQTYQNFEYIIIDGGSTDDTLSIIESYKEKFAEKLTVVSEKDNGIYDAMNKGIKLAKGELVGIVNSDDFYEIDALENIVNEYQNEKYAVYYGMLRVLAEGKEQSILFYNQQFLKQQMINHPSCFVTKAVYDDFGVYSSDYKSAADYEFMLRISREAEVVFKPVYKIISNFSSGGMSNSMLGMQETYIIKKKYDIISTKVYLFKRMYCMVLNLFKKVYRT